MKKKIGMKKLNSIRYLCYFMHIQILLFSVFNFSKHALAIGGVVIYLVMFSLLGLVTYACLSLLEGKNLIKNKIEKNKLQLNKIYLRDFIFVSIISYVSFVLFYESWSLRMKLAGSSLVFIPGLILNYIITKKVYSLKD